MHELFVAVSHGRADDVERLYSQPLLSHGESGFKLFSRLFKHAMRQTPINTQILQHLSQSVNESNAPELHAVFKSALSSAARVRGSLESVQWLVTAGLANPSAALLEAALGGHVEILE